MNLAGSLIAGFFAATLSDLPLDVGPQNAEVGSPIPKAVSISVVDATIGPAKIGNKSWDCCARIPVNTGLQVAKLMKLAVTPEDEIFMILACPILAGESAPDPFGWAEVAIDGEYVSRLKHAFFPPKQFEKNTFHPIFPAFDWKDIPLNDGTRIKVTLFDKDLTKNDDIGVAEVNSRDLVAALRAEKVYQVKVGDQTQNQLLFVGISVRERKN